MSWDIHEKEFQSVLALSSQHRYSYFIKRVADWQQLWSLWHDDGWVLYGDDLGHELIPIWPHPQFAQACATGEWTEAIPRVIEVHEWVAIWTPGMIRDNRLAAVFPVPSERGTVVSPERLRVDLEEELSRIE